MARKYSLVIFSVFIMLLLLINSNNAYGISGVEQEENTLDGLCEFSEEYLKWLDMTEEEREGYIMPTMCKTPNVKANSFSKYSVLKASATDSSYSSVANGYITSVKNQGNTGSCWTFAANATLESYMKKTYNETYDLSERHMEYATSYYFLNNQVNPSGFNRNVGDGGNIFVSSAYYLNKQGPVLESAMPFQNNENLISLSSIQNKTIALDVNDITISPYNDCASAMGDMKNHIIKYGAMSSSIHMDESASYFNSSTSAFYYDGSGLANHAITIVGWDDNYSKNNFTSIRRPSSNGAWIVKNSYGSNWGNNGYFYVSYQDTLICSLVGGVTDADKTFSDHLYSYDTYGFNGASSLASGYVANRFTKDANLQTLTEVTFAINQPTTYEIYVIPKKVTDIKLTDATKISSGYTAVSGYKTVKFDKPILLPETEFTVIVKYTGTDSAIPLSLKESSWYSNVSILPNQSFIANTSGRFEDLYGKYSTHPIAVASVKAETNDVNYEINTTADLSNIFYNKNEGGTYNIPITTRDIQNNETVIVTITKDGSDVTNKFNITGNKINNNSANISVVVPANTVDEGDYKITIAYATVKVELPFTIYSYQDLYINDTDVLSTIYSNEISTLNFSLISSGFEDGTEILVKIYNSDDEDITSDFDITKQNITSGVANVKIITSATIAEDEYRIEFKAGSKTTTFDLSVRDYISVSSVSFEKNKEIMVVGNTKKLNAIVTPNNATVSDIEWSSSDNNIVTVTEDGTVKAIAKGSATITAKSKDSRVNKEATIIIETIKPEANFSTLAIVGYSSSDTSNIYAGYGGKISGSITLQDVTEIKLAVYTSSGTDISSRVSITKSAVVDNVVTFEVILPSNLGNGSYYIKAIGSYIDNGATISTTNKNANFIIKAPVLVSSISASSVRMANTTTNRKISYTVAPSNANNKNVTFITSNTNIVTVGADGTIYPRGLGTATITIKSVDGSNKSTSIQITIVDEIFINTSYNVNSQNNISNINANTSYSSFVNSLTKNGNTIITLYDMNGYVKTDGYIGTGTKVIKTQNGVTTTYTAVITGDISGDGVIKSNDALLIERKLVGLSTLNGAQVSASDVSRDGRMATNDSLLIKRYLVGLSPRLGG